MTYTAGSVTAGRMRKKKRSLRGGVISRSDAHMVDGRMHVTAHFNKHLLKKLIDDVKYDKEQYKKKKHKKK